MGKSNEELIERLDKIENFVEYYDNKVKRFESWMRENVYDFHRPGGGGNSDKWDIWHCIAEEYEDAKTEWRKWRKQLSEIQLELRKKGEIPSHVVENEIPIFNSRKEIAHHAQWKWLIWDYASKEFLKEEIEWAEEHGYNYIVDRIQDWWAREVQVLSWNDDAPEILKSIKAYVAFSNGYYPNMWLYTEGGDYFLSVEYHSQEGLDGKEMIYDNDKIYTIVDDFYKDIFTYLVGLRAIRKIK